MTRFKSADNDINYGFTIEAIKRGRCILMLGPHFGQDIHSNSIYQQIHDHLEAYWGDKIDYRYENLFIFSNPESTYGSKKFELISYLRQIHTEIKPHSIYDTVAKIPFSVIINCSNDNYLKSAFERVGMDFTFDYYNGDGYFENKRTSAKEDSVTSICNVFGTLEDTNSVILDYDMFYLFLSSVMSENQSLPPNVSEKIAKAELFLLMGFDLSKWYIPLLVYRLNRFGQDAKSSFQKREGYINGEDMQVEEDSLLQKAFPLRIKMLQENSIGILERLWKELKPDRKPTDSNDDLESKILELKTLITKPDLRSAIIQIKSVSIGLNLDDLTLIEGQVSDLEIDSMAGKLTPSEVSAKKAIIRDLLLKLLNKARKVDS